MMVSFSFIVRVRSTGYSAEAKSIQIHDEDVGQMFHEMDAASISHSLSRVKRPPYSYREQVSLWWVVCVWVTHTHSLQTNFKWEQFNRTTVVSLLHSWRIYCAIRQHRPKSLTTMVNNMRWRRMACVIWRVKHGKLNNTFHYNNNSHFETSAHRINNIPVSIYNFYE